MNSYQFVARSPTGHKIKGVLNVDDEEVLKNIMIEHDCYLIRYKKKKNKTKFFSISKITKKDLVSLCEKLKMLLKSGIKLSEALDLTAESVSKIKFKEILEEISNDVKKGKTFSQAMLVYDKYFPELFRTMIGLAEISGKMINVLDYLINYYNYEIKMKKKILSSLFYPALLVILAVVVLVVVSVVVIPTFPSMFNQMNVKIPLLTRIIMGIANFIRKYFILLIIGVIGIIFLLGLYFNTPKGKYFFDKMKVRFPLLRKFYIARNTVKFCKCLSMLLDSGLSTIKSLQTTSMLIGNLYIEEELHFVIDEIRRGENLSRALDSVKIYPEFMIQTLIISEQTSSLGYSLKTLSDIYEDDSQNQLTKITNIIEPLFILLISAFVVLLVAAIFIPLLTMLDNIGSF